MTDRQCLSQATIYQLLKSPVTPHQRFKTKPLPWLKVIPPSQPWPTPSSLMVLVKCSRELLDENLNIGSALPNSTTAAIATEMDHVALEGTGVHSIKRFWRLSARCPRIYKCICRRRDKLHTVRLHIQQRTKLRRQLVNSLLNLVKQAGKKLRTRRRSHNNLARKLK